LTTPLLSCTSCSWLYTVLTAGRRPWRCRAASYLACRLARRSRLSLSRASRPALRVEEWVEVVPMLPMLKPPSEAREPVGEACPLLSSSWEDRVQGLLWGSLELLLEEEVVEAIAPPPRLMELGGLRGRVRVGAEGSLLLRLLHES
jgi:hypothetical protein